MTDKKWTLKRYDPLEKVFYDIEGDYNSEDQAEKAAQNCLKKIEIDQPTSNSGGQSERGIQDRVFLVSPEGKEKRIWPKPETWEYSLEEATSFEDMKKALGGSEIEAHMRSVQILQKMIDFIRDNVKVSGTDMKKIKDAFQKKKYNEAMIFAERIYQQHLGVRKFSPKAPTLLVKIISEGCLPEHRSSFSG